jgi:NADPH:quinone reductase
MLVTAIDQETMTDRKGTMKAIVHERYGRPEVLELREVEKPVPEENQVLVRVHAASVNPVEWYGVTGFLPARIGGGLRKPKDTTVGGDLAGRVEAVGRDVTQVQPGDEVFGTSGSSWAEYTIALEERLAPKPANLSFEEAAAVPVAGITALQALRDHGQVQPGQKVLINGASGGVGTFAVQIAKALGAEVTGVCSTTKVELVRSLGADDVVAYGDDDWGDPVDYALDAVGGELLTPAVAALAPGGRLVAYSSGGGTIQAYDLLVGAKSVIGFQMARIARGRPELYERWRQELWHLFDEGALKPAVHAEFALQDAAKAHAVIESRANLGKVVLRP